MKIQCQRKNSPRRTPNTFRARGEIGPTLSASESLVIQGLCPCSRICPTVKFIETVSKTAIKTANTTVGINPSFSASQHTPTIGSKIHFAAILKMSYSEIKLAKGGKQVL